MPFHVLSAGNQWAHVGDGFFEPTKRTGIQHRNFLIFDGKQHPKNIWFRGC